MKDNITESLAHTKWNCKYHIVFAPKYRRKVFFDEKRKEIREILRTLCKWKGVEVIEGEICPDHIHTYTCINTTQNERFGIYGVFERKKQFNNISKVWEYEICIPKPRILVQGILCRYSRKEYESDKRIYSDTIRKRQTRGSIKYI